MKKEKNYKQEFERKYSEQNHKIQIQKIVHETREELLEKVKALDQRQHMFPKDCVKCNYRGDYFVSIEPNLDEFSYKSLEEDIAEVICPKNEPSSPTNDKMDSIEKNISVKVSNELFKQFITVHSVNFVLPGDYRTVSELATKYALEESFNVTEQKLLKTVQRLQVGTVPQENTLTPLDGDTKTKHKKGHIINRLRTPSQRKTQKRNKKQKARAADIKERLGKYDSIVFKQKLLAATKTERKSFTNALRRAILEFSWVSSDVKTPLKESQVKKEISELNKKFPLNPEKIPLPYHDLKTKFEYEKRVINQYQEKIESEKQDALKSNDAISYRDLKPVREILESYFTGSRHAISIEQQIVRNHIQDSIGYKSGGDALSLVLRHRALKKAVRECLNEFKTKNQLEHLKKLLVAIKKEQKNFTYALQQQILEYNKLSNDGKPSIKKSQLKKEISELHREIAKSIDTGTVKTVKRNFEDYFARSRQATSIEQQIVRNYIQDNLESKDSEVAWSLVLRYVYEFKFKNEIVKLKNEIKSLKNPKSQKKKIIASYEKYQNQKQPIKKSKVKKSLKSVILPHAAKLLGVFGITLLSLMVLLSDQTISFPVEVISGFLYLQIFIYVIALYYSIENYVLTVKKLVFLFLSPGLLLLSVSLFLVLNWVVIATLCTPVFAGVTYLLTRKRLRINIKQIPLRSKGRLKYGTFNVFYHKIKFPLLSVLGLALGAMFLWSFFADPYALFIPPTVLLVAIFVLTFKSKTIARKVVTEFKRQKQKANGVRPEKRHRVVVYDKNKRAALLILVFLVFFPITFGINSMATINNPAYLFASVSQQQRLSSSSIDFDSLEYYSDLDDLGKFSINDKFVIKCEISPTFGQSARVLLELTPKDVPSIDGRYPKKSYSVRSPYLNGPVENQELITEVNLNELSLLPGTYEAKVTYSILTGFSFKISTPEIYEITIEKDRLTVVSNEIFEEELDSKYYGAVYTFEHPDDNSWTVVFDGKVVNTIRKPYPVDSLNLFVEDNDQYKKIVTIPTRADGSFYYKHKIYGSIEQNMLVKISYSGDGHYKPMEYVEYAGLEFDSTRGRYFLDENEDLYPDWPFSIYDLLKMHASSYAPPTSIDFWAKFDENTEFSTFDEIHSLEGTLEGNTTWTNGKNDYGLSFDGDGDILVEENIGSTIYNMYANVSFEYGGVVPVIASMTEQGDTAPSTSLTLNKPLGVESGDLLLLIVMNDDRSATAFSDNKNGWNFLNTSGDASSQAHIAVFWKISDGTEGPTETVTSAGEDEWMGYYLRITGADSTTPINANNFAQSSSSSSSHVIPAVTTTANDCLVLYGLSFDGGDGYPFDVSGTGWSEEGDYQTGTSGTGDVSGCFGSKNLTSHGSSGSATVSCTLSDGAAYFQLAIKPDVTQGIGTVRPNNDISAQWETSAGGSHYVLIDEVTLDTSDYIYTSSLTSGNVTDDFNSTTLDIQSGVVKEIQVKIFGVDNETGIDSTINVYCGSWLGIKPLNMESGEGLYTFTWSGLSLSQTDLDGMKIKFESEQPTAGGTTHEDFDYVQFGDVLDATLGASNNEFVITGWLFPTSLTPNENDNGVKNVFFAKDGNIEIGINESGFLLVYLCNASAEAVGTYGFANAIALNQWIYIAIRYNKSDVDVLIGDLVKKERSKEGFDSMLDEFNKRKNLLQNEGLDQFLIKKYDTVYERFYLNFPHGTGINIADADGFYSLVVPHPTLGDFAMGLNFDSGFLYPEY